MLSKPIPLPTVYNVLGNLWLSCTRCLTRNDLLFIEFEMKNGRPVPVCKKCGERLRVGDNPHDNEGHTLKKVCLSLLQEYYRKNVFAQGAQAH